MKFAPVHAASIRFDDDGTPQAPAYGDVYHARAGALEQARAVFLAGNGLPERWRGRERFVIVETGFGLGHNFLAAWQAWREDPQRPRRLFFVSVEKHPARLADLRQAHQRLAGTAFEPLAQALHRQWPEPSPDLHRLGFDDERVVLLLAHADVGVALREWRLAADACFLDGFSPERNEAMWAPAVLKALGHRCTEGATAATWCAASAVRHALSSAGFEVHKRPGFSSKREMTVAVRRGARRPIAATVGTPWAAPASPLAPAPDEPVLIIGAGVAGAACARALSAAGRRCIVLDREGDPAMGASGNPAGLVHGVVHPEDGAHARLSRAAAAWAQRHYGALIEQALIQGRLEGLLRREDRLSVRAMQAQLEALGLPPSVAQAVEDEQGQAWWRYPGGGWIDPRSWVRWVLAQPGIEFRSDATVTRLERRGSRWQLRDARDQLLAEGSTVVLCAAAQVLGLLPTVPDWPLGQTRGQITRWPVRAGPVPQPTEPVSGSGYAMTGPNGDLLCGATTHHHDPDPSLRDDDHRHNLRRASQLLRHTLLGEDGALPQGLDGRVGWRFHADDRLPLVGPVPGEPGLFLCTGLGSRGLTWAPLMGEVLAHWVTGDPAPLPATLLDAIDPYRFERRQARRQAAQKPKVRTP